MNLRSCIRCGESNKKIVRQHCPRCYRRAIRAEGLPPKESKPDGCSVCGKAAKTLRRGMCSPHYQAAVNAGTLSGLTHGPCVEDGCPNRGSTRGRCTVHYQKWVKRGRGVKPRKEYPATCAVEGCGRPHDSKGYCTTHYARLRTHGDPLASVPIKVRPEVPAKYISEGYVFLPGGIREHRAVMEQALGRPLEPHENVHHKNTIRHDNRPENLELWISAQPSGGRVEDMIEHAVWLLQQYAPEFLAAEAATQATGEVHGPL